MNGKVSRFVRFERFLTLLAKFCTLISGLCLITLVVTFGWLVFGRYVLNSTPTWVEQLALLLIVLITFLSSSVGIREHTHLSVEIVPRMLAKNIRSKLYTFISLILCGFGIVMMLEAYNLTAFNWTTEIPLLNVPEGLRTIPMVISGALLVLFSIGNILSQLVSRKADDLSDFNEIPHQNDDGTISQENPKWD